MYQLEIQYLKLLPKICKHMSKSIIYKDPALLLHYFYGSHEGSGKINNLSNTYKHLSLDKAYKQLQDDTERYVPMIGVGFPYNRNFSRSRKKKEICKMTIKDLLKKDNLPYSCCPRRKR